MYRNAEFGYNQHNLIRNKLSRCVQTSSGVSMVLNLNVRKVFHLGYTRHTAQSTTSALGVSPGNNVFSRTTNFVARI